MGLIFPHFHRRLLIKSITYIFLAYFPPPPLNRKIFAIDTKKKNKNKNKEGLILRTLPINEDVQKL